MRILVTAASKHGATAELAEWMGAALRTTGADVDVRAPELITGLDGVDAVILGSGVYAGHWLEPAKELVDRHATELRTRPVWLFSSGPVGEPPKPDEAPVDVAPIVEVTGAREHRIFSGRIDRSLLGFGERAICMALRVPEGDWRARPEVEGWARGIALALSVPGATPSAPEATPPVPPVPA
jgi:menaquinone-dependent protoporphyrinogen oxidase